MSLLLDTDVTLTTATASVTLLSNLQQLTSLPPDLANKNNNASESSTLQLSMGNDTQTALVSGHSSSMSTSSSSGGLAMQPSKTGVLMALYVCGSLLLGMVL